jgi:hypothetical protein
MFVERLTGPLRVVHGSFMGPSRVVHHATNISDVMAGAVPYIVNCIESYTPSHLDTVSHYSQPCLQEVSRVIERDKLHVVPPPPPSFDGLPRRRSTAPPNFSICLPRLHSVWSLPNNALMCAWPHRQPRRTLFLCVESVDSSIIGL